MVSIGEVSTHFRSNRQPIPPYFFMKQSYTNLYLPIPKPNSPMKPIYLHFTT